MKEGVCHDITPTLALLAIVKNDHIIA